MRCYSSLKKNQVLKATQSTPQTTEEKSYLCLTAFETL